MTPAPAHFPVPFFHKYLNRTNSAWVSATLLLFQRNPKFSPGLQLFLDFYCYKLIRGSLILRQSKIYGVPRPGLRRGGLELFLASEKGGHTTFLTEKTGGPSIFSATKQGGHYPFLEMKSGGSNFFLQSSLGGSTFLKTILRGKQLFSKKNFNF